MGSANDRHTGGGGEALITIRDLHKRYINGGRESIDIFTGAQLDIQPAESVAVVGASGVGKSTFLHIIGTLDRPDQGSVLFEGRMFSNSIVTSWPIFATGPLVSYSSSTTCYRSLTPLKIP